MDAAETKLFQDSLPLAYHIARHYWHPVNTNTGQLLGMGLEDMRQIAALALFRAVLAYERSRGTPQKFFAARISQRCIDALRKVYDTQRQRPIRLIQGGELPPAGERHNEIDTDELMACLDARQREIVRRHYFDGKNLRQIAALTGIAYSTVWELHSRAIKKMRRKAAA